MASTVSNDIIFAFASVFFLFLTIFMFILFYFIFFPVVPRGNDMHSSAMHPIQSLRPPVDKDGGERPASRTAPAF